MARKKVPRTLTPLPTRRRLYQAEHKTEELVEILREAATRNQREQPRAFYSMREVSGHFGIPFAVVSRVYNRLGQEGLLTAVRGSKTLLQGQRFDRQLSVRAFVGLPASLSSFVTVQAYRMFFIKIRRELRVRGFATAMLFFENSEARTAVLSDRLKTYEVDTVLWFQPPKEARETVARLKDRGVRVIGIAHEQIPNIPCRYHVRRDQAIYSVLSQWKLSHDIGHVTIAQWPEKGAPLSEEALRSAVDETGLDISITTFRGQRSEAFVRSLRKVKSGAIVFCSAQLASQLCFRAPSAVADLLRARRVAFLNGPVSMPFTKVP
jgi:DNA-binding transcriptional regulator YhcF (GntR family)